MFRRIRIKVMQTVQVPAGRSCWPSGVNGNGELLEKCDYFNLQTRVCKLFHSTISTSGFGESLKCKSCVLAIQKAKQEKEAYKANCRMLEDGFCCSEEGEAR